MARENRIKEVDRNQQCSPPRGGIKSLRPFARATGLGSSVQTRNFKRCRFHHDNKNRPYWTYFYCHGGDVMTAAL